MINFEVKENENNIVVEFNLTSGVITPEELKKVNPPQVKGDKIVVISGRGPIWLYGYLAHFYHYCMGVAFYDPRLNGGVVVQSHTPNVFPGDIIPC